MSVCINTDVIQKLIFSVNLNSTRSHISALTVRMKHQRTVIQRYSDHRLNKLQHMIANIMTHHVLHLSNSFYIHTQQFIHVSLHWISKPQCCPSLLTCCSLWTDDSAAFVAFWVNPIMLVKPCRRLQKLKHIQSCKRCEIYVKRGSQNFIRIVIF